MKWVKKSLTTGEVAKRCRVTHGTVLRWIQEGYLEAYQLPSGHKRITEKAFREFLRKWKFPVGNKRK